MPLAAAVESLRAEGFSCSAQNPVTCSRMRQRLLPSTCVERVNLYASSKTAAVDKIEVEPIACAGF